MNTRKTAPQALLAGAAVLALSLTACSGDAEGPHDGSLSGATITVGSKEYSESVILGYITAAALENAGAETVDQTGINGSGAVREALVSGEIDIYWDYTGTGWVNHLGHTAEDAPEDLYAAVAEEDEANDVAWLPPAEFENTFAITAKNDFAAEHGITSISDVAEFAKQHPSDAAFCTSSEFLNRDDGLPGLQDDYDFEFSENVELELNLIFSQVGSVCEFGVVNSTDGRILTNDLAVLDDDRGFFVEYAGAVTLRQEVLDEYPEIAEIFAPISEALTTEAITALNSKVDNDGEDPRDVAEEWLADEGLIG